MWSRSAMALVCLLLAGCSQEMAEKGRVKPMEGLPPSVAGPSARPLVPGTVPRGFLRLDRHLYEGRVEGKPVETFPFRVTRADLERGRERYGIFCVACHDALGSGRGVVVERGFRPPETFHSERLREAPVGHLYDAIARGFGAMPDFAASISPRDRWLVVAYVRALQLSQHARPEDVPPGALEAGTRTIPAMALLFVPLAFGMGELYVWARPRELEADPHLTRKAAYLNVPFFLARAAACFAAWGVMSSLLCRWSDREDRTGDPALRRKMQLVSGPGLVAYGLTMSVAAADWSMSLEPTWSSSIYPPLVLVGQTLGAFAAATVILALLAHSGLLGEAGTPDRFHDLGNLLLTFVLLWTYLSFSQYLILWSGDLPEERTWHARRAGAAWAAVAGLLIVAHFALPFVLLLSRRVKRSVRALGWVAAFILAMRVVDVFWQVVPAFHPTRVRVHWLDGAALLGIGGIWLAVFLTRLRSAALLPLQDPPTSGGTIHGV